jgi:hypothetical protein
MKSEKGNKPCVWNIGEWKKINGKLIMCKNGFHCSEKIIDALSWVRGEILAEVEVGEKHIIEEIKSCHSEMRVVKAWRWTKRDSVQLAIFAAELVIDIFEKKHPDDKRPREAIEAAIKWLQNPTEKNRKAARAAADAAYAARAAARAAADAAYAADAAADAADAAYAADAADAAADAAYAADAADAAADAADAADAAYAADAAADAARAAADAAIKEKIENWLLAHIEKLEEICEG